MSKPGKGALEEGAAVMVCKKKNIKGRYYEAKVTKVCTNRQHSNNI